MNDWDAPTLGDILAQALREHGNKTAAPRQPSAEEERERIKARLIEQTKTKARYKDQAIF